MTRPTEAVDWPDEWAVTSAPVSHRAFKVAPNVTLVMVLFADDTNAFAMVYPGGARFARIAPETGYALEERFVGRPPKRERLAVEQAWRKNIDAIVKAGRLADDEGLPR